MPLLLLPLLLCAASGCHAHLAKPAVTALASSRKLVAADNTSTASNDSHSTGQGAGNSSTSAFRWEEFAGTGEDAANLIVVFRHSQVAERFRPVCGSIRKRQRQQQQQLLPNAYNTSSGRLSAYSSEDQEASEACGALLGACRHLYRHAFSGETGKVVRAWQSRNWPSHAAPCFSMST